MVKTVQYEHTNSYEILHPITAATTHVWICFHGLGYLSTYFKKYFVGLDTSKHAVIVPQAPSKFYIDKSFKNVGACWLTRVDTMQELDNNIKYIKQVLDSEGLTGDPRIVLMGYSQGVSIACRFLAQYQYKISALIMHSGSIPAELDTTTAQHYTTYCNRFIHISGTRDEYATETVVQRERNKIELLFGTHCEMHTPDIKHEVAVDLLTTIATTL